MQYNHHFFSICFLIASVCNGMDKVSNSLVGDKVENKFDIIDTVTAIQDPHKVQFLRYLTEKELIVVHKNKCSTVDIATNKEIRQFDGVLDIFVMDRDKKKLVSLRDDKTAVLYNIETGKEEWS